MFFSLDIPSQIMTHLLSMILATIATIILIQTMSSVIESSTWLDYESHHVCFISKTLFFVFLATMKNIFITLSKLNKPKFVDFLVRITRLFDAAKI